MLSVLFDFACKILASVLHSHMIKTHARYPKGIVKINRLIFLHKLGIRVIFNTEVRRFLCVEEPRYALTVNSCLMVQRLGDICRVPRMPCFTGVKTKREGGKSKNTRHDDCNH